MATVVAAGALAGPLKGVLGNSKAGSKASYTVSITAHSRLLMKSQIPKTWEEHPLDPLKHFFINPSPWIMTGSQTRIHNICNERPDSEEIVNLIWNEENSEEKYNSGVQKMLDDTVITFELQ